MAATAANSHACARGSKVDRWRGVNLLRGADEGSSRAACTALLRLHSLYGSGGCGRCFGLQVLAPLSSTVTEPIQRYRQHDLLLLGLAS